MIRFKTHLENRLDFGSRTYAEIGRPFWMHHQVTAGKYLAGNSVAFPFVVTHFHATMPEQDFTLNRHCNLASLDKGIKNYLALSLLNSSAALFWLKQVCFCKRASENPETDDYYEFAGGKVEQLPVPQALLQDGPLRRRAEALAERCAEMGEQVPRFHPRKLFERPGEAYTDWYRAIRGYQEPHPGLFTDWQTAEDLRTAWQLAMEEMRALRRQMVPLQEEMDWLMYGAYGLLPLDHPAVNVGGPTDPLPIEQLERPYRLVQHECPIPANWPDEQQALWRARLMAIAENEYVGQLEQPAYKRRWVEPFDDKDFLQAYEWWLREKAEWLLEHNCGSGPVALDDWAEALLQDPRVQAAYRTVLEVGASASVAPYPRERDRDNFALHLKRVIEEETVPDKRIAFKKKHEKLRGIAPEKHLPNGVPRERFRSLADQPGWYVWAGKDIWGGVEGDMWDA
jgi:hypothetical protein